MKVYCGMMEMSSYWYIINSRGAEEKMAIQDSSTQRHYPLINFRETNICMVKPYFPKTQSSK